MATNGIVLLIAGHETTANMIALSTLALLENPGKAAQLRDTDDPKLIANTVEELMRYLTIGQDKLMRMALEDVEIGGNTIRAGEGVAVSLAAGNRDTDAFTDPDVLDLDRKNARMHLGFGFGIHQCLGQALARMEMQVALPTLLHRLPDLRLANPIEQRPIRHGLVTYGVHELPVAW